MKPAVIFDLGNTLAAYYQAKDFQPIMEEAIVGVLDELRLRGLCRVSLETALSAAPNENREAADFKFIPMLERLERIFSISVGSDVSLSHALCSRFLQPIFALGRVYADTLPALSALRASGYPIGIVSNSPWGSPPDLWRIELDRLGLASAVDAIVLCGDVGWRKPASAIFIHAASTLGRSCNECIFIGDDIHWDMEGSAGAGMRPILINRDKRQLEYAGEQIYDLNELVALIRDGE